MVAWAVGERAPATARILMERLASRVAGRIQLTTDAHRMYLGAIRQAFSWWIDYGQLVKEFDAEDRPRIRKARLIGNPDPRLISTSMVERANLDMRTRMRRLVRQTTSFSRKAENHEHAVDLNFMVSNFVLPHGTLSRRYGTPTTPGRWPPGWSAGPGRCWTLPSGWTTATR